MKNKIKFVTISLLAIVTTCNSDCTDAPQNLIHEEAGTYALNQLVDKLEQFNYLVLECKNEEANQLKIQIRAAINSYIFDKLEQFNHLVSECKNEEANQLFETIPPELLVVFFQLTYV